MYFPSVSEENIPDESIVYCWETQFVLVGMMATLVENPNYDEEKCLEVRENEKK